MMAVDKTILVMNLIVIFASTPTFGTRALESACSEACRDWEDWRKECFAANCQESLNKGEDWFPCFLTCWTRASSCLNDCAKRFWNLYLDCSPKCQHQPDVHRCQHKCVVKKFLKIRQEELIKGPDSSTVQENSLSVQ